MSNSIKKPVSDAQTRAQTLTARFQASVTVPVEGDRNSLAFLEAQATNLRAAIEAGERPHATAPAVRRAQVAARLLPMFEAQIEALEEEAADVTAQGDDLLGENFLAIAPEMLPLIARMRALLIKFSSGTLSVHDDGELIDVQARSGFLLARADGQDVSAAVAVYESSMHWMPDGRDDEDYNNDFGRYGGPREEEKSC